MILKQRGKQDLETGSIQQLTESKFFEQISTELAQTGFGFYNHGWLYGTSGNLSAVLRRDPFLLAITGSGLDKGHLDPGQMIQIDHDANVLLGKFRPSAETALHIGVIDETGCGSVFHTHSVWTTLVSRKYEKEGGIRIEGFEMLKGLEGVRTHEHTEWIPIFPNTQDMDALSLDVREMLRQNTKIHGFMLSGHGLYTWGKDMQETKRHVEVLEFLIEAHGRANQV